MVPKKAEVSRRCVLQSVPMLAGAAVCFGMVAVPDAAKAQSKLSHEQAKYQDEPKDGQQCSTCLQFQAPNACQIVASPISPQAWCQFYAKKGS
jgi:hypothetical protein